MMKHNISWCVVPVVRDTNKYIMSNVCEGTLDCGLRRCKGDEESVLCQFYRTTNA